MTNSVAQRIRHANNMLGSRELSGWCEMFVRQCFGFGARYGSALQAWNDTKRRHRDINNAPAGVPIFWNLHPANPNYRFGHVALSVGGGYCVSTSVGPGKSIGKVKIADLTRSWQMTPLGWTEDYHGEIIYGEAAQVKPVIVTPPTVKKDWFDMATEKDLERVINKALSDRGLSITEIRRGQSLHAGKVDLAVQRTVNNSVIPSINKVAKAVGANETPVPTAAEIARATVDLFGADIKEAMRAVVAEVGPGMLDEANVDALADRVLDKAAQRLAD